MSGHAPRDATTSVKKSSLLVTLGLSLVLSACSSTTLVKPVTAPTVAIDVACIERNDDVYVDDLRPAIEAAFLRNGIRTRVFDAAPAPCPYRVTYSASRRWDLTAFMSEARISLYQDRELMGEAIYSLPSGVFGGGGINPDKWRGAAYKIDPLMDKMLAGARRPRP